MRNYLLKKHVFVNNQWTRFLPEIKSCVTADGLLSCNCPEFYLACECVSVCVSVCHVCICVGVSVCHVCICVGVSVCHECICVAMYTDNEAHTVTVLNDVNNVKSG